MRYKFTIVVDLDHDRLKPFVAGINKVIKDLAYEKLRFTAETAVNNRGRKPAYANHMKPGKKYTFEELMLLTNQSTSNLKRALQAGVDRGLLKKEEDTYECI